MSPSQAEVARHYAQFQILTATHSKKICMLHVRCVELVLIAMNSEGPGYRTVELVKARKIIARLMAALTEQDSVSKSLYYLYDYCHALLGRANEDDCKNALKILKTLRNTFEELLKTL